MEDEGDYMKAVLCEAIKRLKLGAHHKQVEDFVVDAEKVWRKDREPKGLLKILIK